MNQVTNRIPYGLLNEEEREGFSRGEKNNGAYEYYENSSKSWEEADKDSSFLSYSVYRLVIEDDKWYWIEDDNGEQACLGEFINQKDITKALILRPARKGEIPQDERTLEQRIQEKWPDKEVVMLEWGERDLWTMRGHDFIYTTAQSMKGFYKYVYEQDNDLIVSLQTLKSWKCKTIQPVAVLFEEGRL